MSDTYKTGMKTRRGVLGNAHVDHAETKKTDFDAPFQEPIFNGVWDIVWNIVWDIAWDIVWARPDLNPRERALIDIWQTNAEGRYRHKKDICLAPINPNFGGCGRCLSDAVGYYYFRTVKPGPVAECNDFLQAPHINLRIVACGNNIGLNTRLYFDNENNSNNPVLNLIKQTHRRPTLIAKRDAKKPLYRSDIRLQGDDQTIFLDI